jgi:hypothetical protein
MARVSSDISMSVSSPDLTRALETRSAMTAADSTTGCSTRRPMLTLKSSKRSTRQRERF